MPLKLNQITGPAIEVVSNTEQKLHAKIDLPDDDLLVDDLNISATEYVTDRLQRAFVTEVWELSLDEFPPDPCPIDICRVPLLTVNSIKYIDTDGVEQTLAADQFIVDTKAEPAAIFRAHLVTWPATRNIVNAVTVNFDIGYGAAAADTPEKFKTIIKQIFTHWYRNREAMKDKTWVEVPEHVNALLSKYELKIFG